eukprot:62546-Chlamydomonas_euryale.AAC.1
MQTHRWEGSGRLSGMRAASRAKTALGHGGPASYETVCSRGRRRVLHASCRLKQRGRVLSRTGRGAGVRVQRRSTRATRSLNRSGACSAPRRVGARPSHTS